MSLLIQGFMVLILFEREFRFCQLMFSNKKPHKMQSSVSLDLTIRGSLSL